MLVFPGQSLKDVDAYKWRSLFGFSERMGNATRGFDPLSPLDRRDRLTFRVHIPFPVSPFISSLSLAHLQKRRGIRDGKGKGNGAAVRARDPVHPTSRPISSGVFSERAEGEKGREMPCFSG